MGIGFDKMFDCFHYTRFSEEALLAKYKLQPSEVERDESHTVTELISYDRTPYFSLRRIDVNGEFTRTCTGKPCAYTVTEGSGTVAGIPVQKGECLFIPAKAEDFQISGNMAILECLPPKV